MYSVYFTFLCTSQVKPFDKILLVNNNQCSNESTRCLMYSQDTSEEWYDFFTCFVHKHHLNLTLQCHMCGHSTEYMVQETTACCMSICIHVGDPA